MKNKKIVAFLCSLLLILTTLNAYSEPEITQITQNTTEKLVGFPSINADGVAVFSSNANFLGENSDTSDELFVFTAPSMLKQITNLSENSFIGVFRIATRSNVIVFSTNGNPLSTNPDSNIEIFTVNSDGSNLQQITNTQLPIQNTFPSIDPKGEVVVYQCTTPNPPDRGGEAEKICLASVSTKTIKLLSDAEPSQFASPTITSFPFIMVTPVLGNHLITYSSSNFEIIERGEDEQLGSFEIFTSQIDQNLSPLRFSQLTKTPKKDLIHKFTPRISDEGNRIAFVISSNRKNLDGSFTPVSKIEAINTDGTNFIDLYPDFEECGDPTINGDGSKIVFSCKADFVGLNPDKNSEIFQFNINASKIEQKTNTTSGDNFFPFIDPTGEFIVWESTANINGQNPEGRNQIYLSGTIERFNPPSMGRPIISILPGFSFLDTKVNDTRTSSFDIGNIGDGDLIVRNINGPFGNTFMITNGPIPPFTLTGGQTAKIDVSFTPLMTGNFMSNIIIRSNAVNRPSAIVSLFGKGIQPELFGQILKAQEKREKNSEGIKFILDTKIGVKNTGNADSGTFSVALFLSEDKSLSNEDKLLKNFPAANLPPNTGSIIKETFELTESSRGKFLIIHVDNLDQVVEKNETNNVKGDQIR